LVFEAVVVAALELAVVLGGGPAVGVGDDVVGLAGLGGLVAVRLGAGAVA
jgi:hypothetical protein